MPRGVDDLEWWADTYAWGHPEAVGRLTLEQYEWFPRVHTARANAARKLAKHEKPQSEG